MTAQTSLRPCFLHICTLLPCPCYRVLGCSPSLCLYAIQGKAFSLSFWNVGGMIGIQRNLSYPSNAYLNPQDEHWSFPVPSEAGSGAQSFVDMIMNSQVHFVFH